MPQHAIASSESFSTNATMSDLPGPGRGIGRLYSRAGKILELCIYRFAHRCGYGPHAVYERFYALMVELPFPLLFRRDDVTSTKTAIVWDTLLKYAQ